MNQADAERTQKYLIKCLGIVAANLIEKKEEPYWIKGDEIDGNGTSRKKTLRLLHESGHIGYFSSREYSSRKQPFCFEREFTEMAEGLAEEPNISAVPNEVKNALRGNSSRQQITGSHAGLSLVGFANVRRDLSSRQKIYVWLHLDDYLLVKSTYDHSGSHPLDKYLVYPQKKLDERKLHATRALFKKYASPMLMPWLAEKFGLYLEGFDAHTEHKDPVAESIVPEWDTKLSLRSVMRFPVTFKDECFDAPKGYSSEYAQRLEWLRVKTGILQELFSNVAEYGYERLMTEFVEYAKEEISAEAPVMMAEGDDAGAGMMILDCIHQVTFDNMFGENNEQLRQTAAA